jgi:HMG (high mobility group) box
MQENTKFISLLRALLFVHIFIEFSNSRRAAIYKENPQATSAEISAMLSQQWREAPEDVKREYLERQSRRREQYKQDTSAWREQVKATGGSHMQEEDSSLLFAQNESNSQGETAPFRAQHFDCKRAAVPDISSSLEDEHKLSQTAKGPPTSSSYNQKGYNHHPHASASRHQSMAWPTTITSRTSQGLMNVQQHPHQQHQPHHFQLPSPPINPHAPTSTSMHEATSAQHLLSHQQRLQFDFTANPYYPSQEAAAVAPLAPLTATDRGSFLAAAAALDMGHLAHYNSGLHTTTTSASTVPMHASVRNVVANLPTFDNSNINNSNFFDSWSGSENDDLDFDQDDTTS